LYQRIRVFIQYVLILGVTFFLLWFSLQGIQVEEGHNKWEYILNTWYSAKKGWLILMVVFFMVSNILRAERWRMLLFSAGHSTTLYKSFLSVMIGYLVNLVIPRGGEVSRCYNLYKLDKIPVEISFGTVVVERIIDVFFLVIVLMLAFSVESEKLIDFIFSLPIQPLVGKNKILMLLGVLIVIGIITGLAIIVLRRNQKLNDRVRKIWSGFKAGLVSVSKVENKSLFVFHSVGIWVLYFLMSYAVIQSFDETSFLGIGAVLSIFAIGTIAMAVPLPGGTGSYHVLIPAGLVTLYQLPKANAVSFTFVFHAWQTLIIIIGGLIALILSWLLLKNNTQARAK